MEISSTTNPFNNNTLFCINKTPEIRNTFKFLWNAEKAEYTEAEEGHALPSVTIVRPPDFFHRLDRKDAIPIKSLGIKSLSELRQSQKEPFWVTYKEEMDEFNTLKQDCYHKALLENGVTGSYEEYKEMLKVDKYKEKEVAISMERIVASNPRLQELMAFFEVEYNV